MGQEVMRDQTDSQKENHSIGKGWVEHEGTQGLQQAGERGFMEHWPFYSYCLPRPLFLDPFLNEREIKRGQKG